MGSSNVSEVVIVFEVVDKGLHKAGGVAQHRNRPANELPVVGMTAPLVAVGVEPGHPPERERVVAQVVVQVDKARVDRTPGTYHGRLLEARGRGRTGRGDLR